MRVLAIILTLTLFGCGPALQYVKQPSDPPTMEAQFHADREACDGAFTMPYVYPVLLAPIMLVVAIQQARAKACMKARGWNFDREPDPIVEALPSRSQ